MAVLISNVAFILSLLSYISIGYTFPVSVPPACTTTLCAAGNSSSRCISELLSCSSGRCLKTCDGWMSEYVLLTLYSPHAEPLCIGSLTLDQRVKCCQQGKRCTAKGDVCYDSKECDKGLFCDLYGTASSPGGTCESPNNNSQSIPKCSEEYCLSNMNADCEFRLELKCFIYLSIQHFVGGP